MGALSIDTVSRFQDWPASIWIFLITTAVYLVVQLAWRPSLPKAAPKLLGEGYPIIGAIRFFSRRKDFATRGIASNRTGNFSFFFGKHQIVGVSGLDGRKTFFESKDLNMSEGYQVLFTTTPSVPDTAKEGDMSFDKWFSRRITTLMKKENFVRNLPILVGDTKASLDAVVARGAEPDAGMMDPFDDIYRIVYRLTMRTVGATEIAESPELLARSLRLFEIIEASSSPARIIFPWLPTPAHLRKMVAGGKLYYMVNQIVNQRKKTGRREEDALQFLIDSGDDMVRILSFVLGSLFAGQLNSGINAAWMFVYLACNKEWYGRVQEEVDTVLENHRSDSSQSPAEILATLTIDNWEKEFPLVDLCLRECIRFQLVGTAFRKNISGKDVPIGKTGEVVPKDAFAIFLLDDVHFNPEIYTEPNRWDPGRYLPERAEDKKQPLSYLGWGIGRHPCLGMRFAKLEMSIIAALFVSMFDFSACDETGKPLHETPATDRNKHAAHKPEKSVRLKYKLRKHVA